MRVLLPLFGLLLLFLVAGCASGPPPRDGDARALVVEDFTNYTLRPEAGRIIADLLATQAAARGWSIRGAETGEGALRLSGAVTEFDYRDAGSRGPALGFTARLTDPVSGRTVWAGSFTGSARGWTGRALNGVATEVVDRALTGMAQRLEEATDGGG